MSNATESTSPPSTAPAEVPTPLSLATLATVLSDRRRWKLLDLLATSEPMMVKELAARLGEPAANVSNHLKMLMRAGIVRIGSGRLYRLRDEFKYAVTERTLDFGYCVLRLDAIAKAEA